MSRPTTASRGAPGKRRRRRPRLDAVVDDLEARLVEPLALGRYRASPAEIAMCTSASPATARSAARERPPVTERVEAVLRRDQHRNAREPAGGEAVKVGVDEVRVQDRRALRRTIRASRVKARRVGGAREAQRARPGPPPRSSRDAKSAAPGSSSWSITSADVEAALAERREEQQQMVLGARDPRDLRDVQYANAHGPASVGP